MQDEGASGSTDGGGAGLVDGRKTTPARTKPAGRNRLPALAEDPILERLEHPPRPAPRTGETLHDAARRRALAEPGQWLVLQTRAQLSETAARRLARSYAHAKPARLSPEATGRFAARPFTRDQNWHVAIAYQPSDPDAADLGSADPAPPLAPAGE